MFTLKFECNTQAFRIDPAKELSRILREVAKDLRYVKAIGQTYDVTDKNGEKIGTIVMPDIG